MFSAAQGMYQVVILCHGTRTFHTVWKVLARKDQRSDPQGGVTPSPCWRNRGARASTSPPPNSDDYACYLSSDKGSYGNELEFLAGNEKFADYFHRVVSE